MARLLDIQNLTVSFRSEGARVRAVSNLNLHVDAGETVAIVGESGSGKSVTALSILRLLGDAGHIDSGSIALTTDHRAQDLVQMSESQMLEVRGNRISMIFQEPMTSLNPVIPVGKQVAEPLVLHRRMKWRDALTQAEELLRQVAIPDPHARLSEYPHQLSGGMRQRIMIAMALACAPQLIIADEPTTALDVTVQAQILALLKDLTDKTGAALILITHDLGVVARYADRVAVMYGGRIMESGSATNLYANPQHPYTQGLMASIPSLDSDVNVRLATIEGQPPDLADPPRGCPFAPRCRFRQTRCDEDVPELEWLEPQHGHACIGEMR